MPFPLMAVAIGAGIGALAGGMSGDDGWDWKRAFGGALLGGATGGVGAGALAPVAATTSGASAGALAGGVGAGSVGGSGAAGLAAIQSGGMATTAGGLSAGIGSTAVPVSYAAYGPTTKAGFAQNEALMRASANPNVGNQFTKAGSEFMTDKTAGSGLDYGKIGQNIQSLTQDSDANTQGTAPEGDNPPLDPITPQDDSVQAELDAEARRIMDFPGGQAETGLSNVAAKGGLATRYGIMKTPSGSLTGGEIVGPGTGTSDTIRSAIYPDVASKLGASSSPMGKGHRVQDAALSDGEFVITAKAVEGVGKNAGAPPGQEREYGSKLLDQAMNQWQRT